MEPSTLFLIVHLIGTALGAGGAIMSDLMFFTAIRDKKLTKSELTFLHVGSVAVWSGFVLLVLSGVGLFYQNPEGFSESTKFIAKMAIVAVIFINGIILHFYHFPKMRKESGKYFYRSKEFMQNTSFLVISGVVSIVSWLATIILGALRSLPYSSLEILFVYLMVVIIVSFIAISRKNKLFEK